MIDKKIIAPKELFSTDSRNLKEAVISKML